MTSIKRLTREYRHIFKEPIENISISFPNDEDLLHWEAIIDGPSETPYQGGKFKIQMKFDDEYPHSPPEVKFLTKIYHPNVNSSGQICLNILRNDWKPTLSARTILLSISSLLASPNAEDPLDVNIATMYRRNRELFYKTAEEWTNMYAIND